MLWPAPPGGDDDLDPVAVVAADDRPPPPGRPWVLANMIASADGSATDTGGRSGGLAVPPTRPCSPPSAGWPTSSSPEPPPSPPRTTAPAARRPASASSGSPGASRRRRASRSTTASLAIEPTAPVLRRGAARGPSPRPHGGVRRPGPPPRARGGGRRPRRRRRAGRLGPRLRTAPRRGWAPGSWCARAGRVTLGQLVADDLLDELCLTWRRPWWRAPDRASPTARHRWSVATLARPCPGRRRQPLPALPARPVNRRAQCRLGAVRLVSSVSSRSKSARSSNPL